jgi:calcineurin-like phosphoesterase family protein
MKNFYISDSHFGHANIIKFDNRPFDYLEQMHEILIKNWNDKVSNEDTVYILGDFCWQTEQEWIELLKQLNGKKVLILGNHDIKNPTSKLKKMFLDIKPYKEITDNGKRVIMSHYPIPMYRGAYNPNIYMLYGHVHNTREEDFMQNLKKQLKETHQSAGDNLAQFYNVGCMMPWIYYTPQTLDDIITGAEEYQC